MQQGKFNAVVDGQWGSTGKGLISTALARQFLVTDVSSTNLPNAGHTAVLSHEGEEIKFISKVLPTSAILNRIGQPITAWIGPGAGFRMARFLQEREECRLDTLLVHPRAMVVEDCHATAEQENTKHVASTMQGSGAVQIDKIWRKEDAPLVQNRLEQYPELQHFVYQGDNWPGALERAITGGMWLHEGSQGFSLGINHGSHYPNCTSRECTIMQAMSDLGVRPQLVGDVYLVIRPYPIRVGHVVEDGEVVGHSGGHYDDHDEIDWETVAKAANAPVEVTQGELTTVTKRLRRVFSFSLKQVQMAAQVNGATKIALNFANYIDWACYEARDWDDLPKKVTDFISYLEDMVQVPVDVVGTSPKIENVLFK